MSNKAEHSWVGGAADGRRRLAGSVTAPVSQESLGLNRPPDARLWVLHGREWRAGVRSAGSCVRGSARTWSVGTVRRPSGGRGERLGDASPTDPAIPEATCDAWPSP